MLRRWMGKHVRYGKETFKKVPAYSPRIIRVVLFPSFREHAC